MKFYDDEGNEYTAEQVRAAADEKAKDEAGEGSFGGLTADQEGAHTPTAGPVAAPERSDVPIVDAPKAKAEPALLEKQPEKGGRELDPRNLGKFVGDNLFGGFNGKYITGKRPMTLFDYVTDAAAAYSGEDLAARNSKIITADAQRSRASTEALKNQRETEKFELEKQKTGLEVDKASGEAIARMMQDYDSDLWPAHLKGLQKEHGINVPGPTIDMVTRMTEKLNKEGATHPADVLENPDKYSPELFNRVRHTMALLNKNVQESQAKDQEIEKGKQALGLREGEEQRKQTAETNRQSGMDEIVFQVLKSDVGPDGQPTPAARRRAAAVLMRGNTADKVVGEEAGVQGSEGRGLGIKVTRDAAIAQIQKRKGASYQPSPDEIKSEMNQIEAGGAAQKTQATKMAGIVAEAKGQAARGLSLVNTMQDAVNNYGLSSSKLGARTMQPLRMMWDSFTNDPKYSVLTAFPATMSNVARALGEKGVLTDTDLARVEAALKPRSTDTDESYKARLQFVRVAMQRGVKAVQDAEQGGELVPADLSDLTYEGDPIPTRREGAPAQTGESASGVSKTAEGKDDRRVKAEQWAAKIKAERDPAKREMMKREAVSELSQ